jgi:hypothetical protein
MNRRVGRRYRRRQFLRCSDYASASVTTSIPQVDPAALELAARPNNLGRYGQFGGQYVPETLIPALAELEQAAAEAWKDPPTGSTICSATTSAVPILCMRPNDSLSITAALKVAPASG